MLFFQEKLHWVQRFEKTKSGVLDVGSPPSIMKNKLLWIYSGNISTTSIIIEEEELDFF